MDPSCTIGRGTKTTELPTAEPRMALLLASGCCRWTLGSLQVLTSVLYEACPQNAACCGSLDDCASPQTAEWRILGLQVRRTMRLPAGCRLPWSYAERGGPWVFRIRTLPIGRYLTLVQCDIHVRDSDHSGRILQKARGLMGLTPSQISAKSGLTKVKDYPSLQVIGHQCATAVAIRRIDWTGMKCRIGNSTERYSSSPLSSHAPQLHWIALHCTHPTSNHQNSAAHQRRIVRLSVGCRLCQPRSLRMHIAHSPPEFAHRG